MAAVAAHQACCTDAVDLRHDWDVAEVEALFALPFADLLYQAQTLHRRCFDPNTVQLSSLYSIKTGGCPEDCAYCPQSAHYDTDLPRAALASIDAVRAAAAAAQANGASRFCMGGAWRSPRDHDLDQVVQMIAAVKTLGMETCCTLGMLTGAQAQRLKDAGLDYYNHNLDTSEEFYTTIISTRTYHDRLETLENVRNAGINVCCGGILGMGEARQDRVKFIWRLASLPQHPESVPINLLVQVAGTPLQGVESLDPLEFVRTIAVARITMPRSYVRLSAGRNDMDDAMQALCFLAGANSVFYGEKLLTTGNPQAEQDQALLARLGMRYSAAP